MMQKIRKKSLPGRRTTRIRETGHWEQMTSLGNNSIEVQKGVTYRIRAKLKKEKSAQMALRECKGIESAE